MGIKIRMSAAAELLNRRGNCIFMSGLFPSLLGVERVKTSHESRLHAPSQTGTRIDKKVVYSRHQQSLGGEIQRRAEVDSRATAKRNWQRRYVGGFPGQRKISCVGGRRDTRRCLAGAAEM
jgi:hypothetical protein